MDFLRGPAWPIRTKLAFKTNHGKRPQGFELFITKDGKRELKWILLDEYPIILPMPVFAPMPPLVTGITESGTLFPNHLVMITSGTTPASELLLQIKQKYSADGVGLPSLDVPNFARMVVKSAYALAVAELGLDNVQGRRVAEAILSHNQDIGQYIGSGSAAPLQPEQAQHLTQVQKITR